MAPPRKIDIVKMVRPRIKLGVQGTSEIELALAKMVGVSIFFCLLDASSSSHGRRNRGVDVAKACEWAARVVNEERQPPLMPG
jgi:hypothetical protein